MHKQGFIHRDIKPDNFALGGSGDRNTIYVLDMGLAKPFRDLTTGQHIAYRADKMLTGTAKFVSINTHIGIEQSRRDDMEGLGYVLLYFMLGDLPWHGIRADSKEERYNKIMECKTSLSVEELCQGTPAIFARYVYYCRELKFEDAPDYSMLKHLFKDYYHTNNYDKDFDFDWNIMPLETDLSLSPMHKPPRERRLAANNGSLPGSHRGGMGLTEFIKMKYQSNREARMSKEVAVKHQETQESGTIKQSLVALKFPMNIIKEFKHCVLDTNESCNFPLKDIGEKVSENLGNTA